MALTRPMLADKLEDMSKLKFPVLASPKLDGIRCLIVNGKAVSRKFKPIPNHHIRTLLEGLPNGLDGEIVCPGKNFNEVQSAVMSEDGEPEFEYQVFDHVAEDLKEQFQHRYVASYQTVDSLNLPYLKSVEHKLILDVPELILFEQKCIDDGYEGAMVRSLSGPYKQGRSTQKEGYLLKIKRFADSEAEVIGFEELLHNDNEKETNELGLSKRSTKKEGMVLAGTLGKFNVRDINTGVEFEIGTGEGLTKELRQEIWTNREKYLGKIVTYKFQPAGMKYDTITGVGVPRFPVFKGFRHGDDT